MATSNDDLSLMTQAQSMVKQYRIQFGMSIVLMVALFASPSASLAHNERQHGTLGFQDRTSITGYITGRDLKFRTEIDTFPISIAKIAGFANQRLHLKGIGVFEGSFVGGTFLIETTQGKVERAAQDILSIQIDPLVSLTGDHAENRIQAVQKGLPFAELSAYIYQCKDGCSVLDGKAGQWTPLLDSRALFKERERALNASQASTAESTPAIRIPQSPMGFRAVAFQSTETNEIAIVYNGTDSIADWATNFAHMNPSWEPKQYSAAIDFAQEVEKRFCSDSKNCRDRVSLTGHSLGGGLAQYAAITFGRKAYTFNAAGLWDSTAGDLDTTVAAQASVVHFKSKGYKFGLPLGADFVPYTGVQFAEHTIEIPVKLPIWSWDAVTLQLIIHNMERLRDAMFAQAATQGDGVLPKAAEPGDLWGPEIVPAVEIGFNPCWQRREHDRCLSELGLSKAAIDFSYALAEDYSGSTVASSFQELGRVDLAVARFIGADEQFFPVLVNGRLGLHAVVSTENLGATFLGKTSQESLRRHQEAENWATEVSSHRLLPDGTQRFTLIETLTEGCRACPILGRAVTFLEVGPSTKGELVRRPIGLDLRDNAGDEGAEDSVRLPEGLQFRLNSRGYDAGPMDGQLGPQTRTALMELQVEHCLPPTGQPDALTVAVLMESNGFEATCADAKLPIGISANSPLRTGIYVDEPAKCRQKILPDEISPLSQRIIHSEPNGITFGTEVRCSTQRTEIRNAVTVFQGTCSEGDAPRRASWIFNVLSNEAFIDMTDVESPRRFTRCADESVLRQASGAWFGDTPAESLKISRPIFSDPPAAYLTINVNHAHDLLMNVFGIERNSLARNPDKGRFGKDMCYYGAVTAGFSASASRFAAGAVNDLAVDVTFLALGKVPGNRGFKRYVYDIVLDLSSSYLKSEDLKIAAARSVIENTFGYLLPALAELDPENPPKYLVDSTGALSRHLVQQMIQESGLKYGSYSGNNGSATKYLADGALPSQVEINWTYSPKTNYLIAYVSASCEGVKNRMYVIRFRVQKDQFIGLARTPDPESISVSRY